MLKAELHLETGLGVLPRVRGVNWCVFHTGTFSLNRCPTGLTVFFFLFNLNGVILQNILLQKAS